MSASQAIPIGQLAKRHAQKLVPAGEGFDLVITVVTAHRALEVLPVNEIGELGEGVFFRKHSGSLSSRMQREKRQKQRLNSSRTHPDTFTPSP